MPDNNYVWIVMEDDVSFPVAVFQKRYDLVAWVEDPNIQANLHFYTILRFRPYDHSEYKIIDNITLRAVNNG